MPRQDDSAPHNNEEASVLALANIANASSSAEPSMPSTWVDQIKLLMQASLKEALSDEGIILSKGSIPHSKAVQPCLMSEADREKRAFA